MALPLPRLWKLFLLPLALFTLGSACSSGSTGPGGNTELSDSDDDGIADRDDDDDDNDGVNDDDDDDDDGDSIGDDDDGDDGDDDGNDD